MGTLLCRQMTRVHPVVSFTLIVLTNLPRQKNVLLSRDTERKKTGATDESLSALVSRQHPP